MFFKEYLTVEDATFYLHEKINQGVDIDDLADLEREGKIKPLIYLQNVIFNVSNITYTSEVNNFITGYFTAERFVLLDRLNYNPNREYCDTYLDINLWDMFRLEKVTETVGSKSKLSTIGTIHSVERSNLGENHPNIQEIPFDVIRIKKSQLDKLFSNQNQSINLKRIAELESQLAQAKAKLTDKPADSITQSNTDIHNIKKEAIKQFNRSLATVLIDLDYKSKLRKGDIANYIVPYMKELAFVLADEQADKADNLTVTYDTLYDTHLQGLGFRQGRQSNDEKEKLNIDLLFKKQLPVTE